MVGREGPVADAVWLGNLRVGQRWEARADIDVYFLCSFQQSPFLSWASVSPLKLIGLLVGSQTCSSLQLDRTETRGSLGTFFVGNGFIVLIDGLRGGDSLYIRRKPWVETLF